MIRSTGARLPAPNALASGEAEATARAAVETLALLAAAAALRASAPSTVAETFARLRLDADRHAMYGAVEFGPGL